MPQTAPDPALSHHRRSVRAEAARLARRGDLDGAVALLTRDSAETDEDVDALHLLARIRAQQGDWLEAERYWTRILAIDPRHGAARDGLARLRRQRRSRPWLMPLAALGILAAAGVTAYAVTILANRPISAEIGELKSDLLDLQRETARTADERLERVETGLRASTETLAASSSDLGALRQEVIDRQKAYAAQSDARLSQIQKELREFGEAVAKERAVGEERTQEIESRLDALDGELDRSRPSAPSSASQQ